MLPHLDDEPLGTALWQVFVDQPHPQLGSGALLTLKLPGSIGVEEVAVTANAVNASERARLASPAFGAWTRDPSDPKSLVHVTFLPSLLSRPGLLENLSIYEMIRSRFAAEAVYGGVGDSTAG
jgi:hypothetical protein